MSIKLVGVCAKKITGKTQSIGSRFKLSLNSCLNLAGVESEAAKL